MMVSVRQHADPGEADGLRLVESQAVHKPLELAQRGPLGCDLSAGGPLHTAPFEPAVMEPNTRLVPIPKF